MKYRLVKRPSQKGHIWHIDWTDEKGKRHRKSTGARTRKDAELELSKLQGTGNAEDVTLRQFAPDFFIWDKCQWIARRIEKGKAFSEAMASLRRGQLVNHILPTFGDMPMHKLNPVIVENWLLTLKLKNTTRNQILDTLHMVLREAVRAGVLNSDPIAGAERFSPRDYVPRDPLADDDIQKLFPDDRGKFDNVWPYFPDGVMFATMLSAGLRSGEARALQWVDVDFELSGLYIRQAFNISMQIGPPKGQEYRAIPIPDKTLELLREHHEKTYFPNLNDFCFCDGKGHPLSRFIALERFKAGIERSKLALEGRNIVVHSLRHTFNTRMRGQLGDTVLRQLTGHKSVEMTDRYDHGALEDRLKTLQPQRPAIDKFWTKEGEKSTESNTRQG